jgi:hypothetical protein
VVKIEEGTFVNGVLKSGSVADTDFFFDKYAHFELSCKKAEEKPDSTGLLLIRESPAGKDGLFGIKQVDEITFKFNFLRNQGSGFNASCKWCDNVRTTKEELDRTCTCGRPR